MFDKSGTRWDITGTTGTVPTQWSTKAAQRGYTAVINYTNPNYTLTITGAGAPAPTAYDTLHEAKDALRHFLSDKPNS